MKYDFSEDEKLREVLQSIISLQNINIEIVGCWIWGDGETYEHKDKLKALGFRWAREKRNGIFTPKHSEKEVKESYLWKILVLCQDLVQVKMRNFSHFNPPEAQPQCVFFHTIVRIHLVTYSCNGYEFVSYCRKLPDIQKSTGMLAYNHGF